MEKIYSLTDRKGDVYNLSESSYLELMRDLNSSKAFVTVKVSWGVDSEGEHMLDEIVMNKDYIIKIREIK